MSSPEKIRAGKWNGRAGYGKINEMGYDKAFWEKRVESAARELVLGKGRVKAILLECSNLPPYAAAVQKAVGLPVFDFNTMIHQVYRAIRQSPYHSSPCNSRKEG
jgi:Asp/Glu/hydantoin racemase